MGDAGDVPDGGRGNVSGGDGNGGGMEGEGGKGGEERGRGGKENERGRRMPEVREEQRHGEGMDIMEESTRSNRVGKP